MKSLKFFLASIIVFGGFVSQARAENPSKDLTWEEKIQQFQVFDYKSRSEVYAQSKLLLNQIEDDSSLRFQKKLQFRKQVSQIEERIAEKLPELKLVGFKKTPIDPSNLKAGFVLEPEYR